MRPRSISQMSRAQSLVVFFKERALDQPRRSPFRPVPRHARPRASRSSPVVRLNGAIGMNIGFRQGADAGQRWRRCLERAFSYPRAAAVALTINSPGGSPVQSHLIHRRIRDLATEKKLPVLAFTEGCGGLRGAISSPARRTRSSPIPPPSSARSALSPRVSVFTN